MKLIRSQRFILLLRFCFSSLSHEYLFAVGSLPANVKKANIRSSLVSDKNEFRPQRYLMKEQIRAQRSLPIITRIRNNFRDAVVDNLSSTPWTNDDGMKRNLQLNIGNTNSIKYEPLRMSFITNDLENLKNGTTIDIKVDYLMQQVLPEVKSFYSNLLSVIPYPQNVIIPPSPCFGQVQDVPESIMKNGVSDSDIVIFVEGIECNDGVAIAAASVCSLSPYDLRPLTGIIFFCMDNDILLQSSSNDRYPVEISKHELAHVLGMNSDLMPFFFNRQTQQPYLDKFEQKWTVCVDNIPRLLLLPSTKVLGRGTSKNGATYFEVVTPTVAMVAKNQFDCETLTGARLENQPTAAGDCFGSHWDERLHFTEAMGAYYDKEMNAFSSLTVAMLEDSGWYIGNYGMASLSTFGYRAGCDFVNSDCIVNGGEVPDYSKDMFCNRTSNLGDMNFARMCSASHKYIAYCDLFDYENDIIPQYLLPTKFQYFGNKPLAPFFFETADLCPVAVPFENGDCTVDEYGNTIENSICVNVHLKDTGESDSYCVRINCNENLRKVEIMLGFDRTFLCPEDFALIMHPWRPEMMVECPRLITVCPQFQPCPSNCSGKGVCKDVAGKVQPQCVCFDENDTSINCNETDFLISAAAMNSSLSVAKEERDIFSKSSVDVVSQATSTSPSFTPSSKPTALVASSILRTQPESLLPTATTIKPSVEFESRSVDGAFVVSPLTSALPSGVALPSVVPTVPAAITKNTTTPLELTLALTTTFPSTFPTENSTPPVNVSTDVAINDTVVLHNASSSESFSTNYSDFPSFFATQFTNPTVLSPTDQISEGSHCWQNTNPMALSVIISAIILRIIY